MSALQHLWITIHVFCTEKLNPYNNRGFIRLASKVFFFLLQSLQLKMEGLEESDHVSIKTKNYLIEMLTSGNQSNDKVTVWKY